MNCRILFTKFLLIIICLILLGCGTTISSIEKEENIEFKVNDSNASYFDVEERMKFIKRHNISIFDVEDRKKFIKRHNRSMLLSVIYYGDDCSKLPIPDPVDYYLVMPAFYENRSGWNKANAPLERFEHYVTGLAELYVATANNSYAKCMAKVLSEWAEKGSLLSFDYEGNLGQAWYAIEWATTSTAMAYSIIKDNPSIESEIKHKIEIWLRKVAKKQTSYPGMGTACCNNHSYWRGLEAAIVGVVTNDNNLFRFGIRKYISALNSMNKDGSFPLEMARGRRAIHYQNFAILPLVYIAEIATRQGYDLYSMNIDGKDLHLAINFLMRCIEDNDIVQRYTASSQDFSFFFKKRELNWMEPYNRRFKNKEIETLLNGKRPINHRWNGGSSTLYFYSPEIK